ncbi:MAG TPA: hypothetical protein VMV10_19305 [Pirellulales bacterium]|nr:hypothetical protein [Pirellulales bacterium]
MSKENKKHDAAWRERQREARKQRRRRRKEYEIIFINGRQKRVRRPPTIEGLPVEEFIARNADPIWLHQNGMWEYITPEMYERAARFDECDDAMGIGRDEVDNCEEMTDAGDDGAGPCSDARLDDLPF